MHSNTNEISSSSVCPEKYQSIWIRQTILNLKRNFIYILRETTATMLFPFLYVPHYAFSNRRLLRILLIHIKTQRLCTSPLSLIVRFIPVSYWSPATAQYRVRAVGFSGNIRKGQTCHHTQTSQKNRSSCLEVKYSRVQ